jgi:putative transposase
MPKPYPREFREDVVAVARKGQATLTQIAKDFGISESCLSNWLRAANVEDGQRPGVTVVADRMTSELAVAALRNAVALRTPAGTVVVHSDRGSQFRSRKFVAALTRAGLAGSMGRVGACADNSAMESFFSLLQKNVLNRRRWATREQLRLANVTWIERTYHRRRRQRALGRLTPAEFETIYATAEAA